MYYRGHAGDDVVLGGVELDLRAGGWSIDATLAIRFVLRLSGAEAEVQRGRGQIMSPSLRLSLCRNLQGPLVPETHADDLPRPQEDSLDSSLDSGPTIRPRLPHVRPSLPLLNLVLTPMQATLPPKSSTRM